MAPNNFEYRISKTFFTGDTWKRQCSIFFHAFKIARISLTFLGVFKLATEIPYVEGIVILIFCSGIPTSSKCFETF